MQSVPLTQSAIANGRAHALTGATVAQLTVANGAVYVQLGHGIGGQLWDDPSFRVPGVHTIPGPLDAIRVRSAVAHAGTPADPWPQYAVDAY
jgi:hypothetical protein